MNLNEAQKKIIADSINALIRNIEDAATPPPEPPKIILGYIFKRNFLKGYKAGLYINNPIHILMLKCNENPDLFQPVHTIDEIPFLEKWYKEEAEEVEEK